MYLPTISCGNFWRITSNNIIIYITEQKKPYVINEKKSFFSLSFTGSAMKVLLSLFNVFDFLWLFEVAMKIFRYSRIWMWIDVN